MKIQATVSYPVWVELDIPESDVDKIIAYDLDVIETYRTKIKEESDKQFESSTVEPIITDSALGALTE